MNNIVRRAIALCIAILMLLSLAACKPKENGGKNKSTVISADDPYFSSKEIEVFTPKNINDSVSNYVVPLGDKVGIILEIYEYGEQIVREETEWKEQMELNPEFEPEAVASESTDVIEESTEPFEETGDEITDDDSAETTDWEDMEPEYPDDGYYYENNIKRMLLVYDLEGNRVGETELAFLSNQESGKESYIQSIQGDGQGNIALLLQSYDYETGRSDTEMVTMDASGKEVKPRVSLSGSENEWYSSVAFDGQGYFYVCSYGETGSVVRVKDAQGRDVSTVKANESQNIGGTLYSFGGSVYVDVYSNTGYEYKIYPIDPVNGSLGEPIDLTGLQGSLSFGPDGMYLNKAGGIYSYDIKTKEQTEIIAWNDTDLDMSDFWYGSCIPMSKDKIVYVTQEYNFGIMTDEEAKPEPLKLVILTREKVNPNAGKMVMVLGGFGISYQSDVTSEIYKYNKESTKYRIETVDYYEMIDYSEIGDDYTDYLKAFSKATEQLYIDMINGVGPDILMAGEGMMSLDRFAAKGLLSDLYKLAEKDESFSKEDYIQSVLSLFETDGKLYQFPTGFYMIGLVGPTRLIGDRTGWTVDEFNEVVNGLPAGVYPIVNVTQSDLLTQCLTLSMNSFVDYSKGEVRFDDPDFYKLLELAKTYGSDSEVNPMPVDYASDIKEDGYGDSGYVDEYELISQGKLALRMTYIYSPTAISNERYTFSEPITFVGYPSSNKSGMACTAAQAFAINAESPNQDAAWEFIRHFIAKEAQMARQDYSGAPIRRDALEAQIEKLLNPPEQSDYYWYGDQLTQEDADQYLAMIDSVSTLSGTDMDIVSIVQEEVPAYFKGLKSAEDVARIIQDRVMTLVREKS